MRQAERLSDHDSTTDLIDYALHSATGVQTDVPLNDIAVPQRIYWHKSTHAEPDHYSCADFVMLAIAAVAPAAYLCRGARVPVFEVLSQGVTTQHDEPTGRRARGVPAPANRVRTDARRLARKQDFPLE